MNRLFALSLFFFSSFVMGQTILIDPGHGGEDQGAKHHLTPRKTIYEKDLALEISKRIYDKLKSKYSVYLTRSYDRTVTLHERAALADKVKADLFISVHINSSRKRGSRGMETYYLDNHKNQAVEKVEEVENESLSGDDLIIKQILTDLVIGRTVNISKKLARSVHGQLRKKVIRPYNMRDRGVKPGLFYVLALSKRPGLLLECGFISNKKELKKMQSASFQEAYADAVVAGINKFFKK